MLVQGLLRELAAAPASVGAVRAGGSVRAEVAVHASAVSQAVHGASGGFGSSDLQCPSTSSLPVRWGLYE
jgi:hypothetical protein